MKRHGFTVIEMLVVVAIIAILVLIVVGSRGCSCASQGKTASDEMRTYMTSLGYEPVGVVCTERDTDSDGYVSCTGTYHDKSGELQTINSECAAGFLSFGNSGCRMPKLTIRRQ